MRLVDKDYITMTIEFCNEVERAFLIGSFSTTLYDFELAEDGILKVYVPTEGLTDFYDFLKATFQNFELYV